MNNFKRNLVGGAVALALTTASGFANAGFSTFGDFQIDEASVPGVPGAAPIVTGDKLNGGYNEQITLVPSMTAGILDFDTWGFATFSALYKDEGSVLVPTYLSPSPSADSYLIRAVFNSTGIYNTGSNVFTGQTATIDYYIDTLSNTTLTYGSDATVTPTLGNTSDDYLIGSATNPTQLLGLPGTPGAFDFIWDDFKLTTLPVAGPNGDKYFIQPRPFYLGLNVNGDFDKANFQPGTFEVTGDVSSVFAKVPEPSALALIGLGFLGLSSFARRNKAN